MKKVLLTLTAVFAALTARSQEKFTLERAQQYALDHAYGVQIAELEIKRAKQIYRQNLAVGLPQAEASAQYAYNLELGGFVADMNGDGVLEKLVFGTDYQAQGNFTVSQLVFNGSYIIGLMAADVLKDGAQLGLEKSKAELKRDVAKAYHVALLSQEGAQLLENNEQLLATLVQELTQLYEAGLISKVEVDQIALNYNNVKNALTYARSQQQVAGMLLKLQMGLPVDEDIQLADGLEDLVAQAANTSHLTTLAFDPTKTLDYLQMANNVQGSKLQVKNRYMEFLPTVGVSYQNNVQYMSPVANIFGDEAVDVPSSLVGASVSVPLWSSGRGTAALQEAKVQRDQALLGLTQMEQGLKMQFASTAAEFNNAIATYLSERESVALAKRIRDQRQKEFEAGMASSMDLTNADTQYQQALQKMFAAAQSALDQSADLNYLMTKQSSK